MKVIKYSILIIIFLFLACSKNYSPVESGTAFEKKIYNLTLGQEKEIFDSLSKAIAITLSNERNLNSYKQEQTKYKNDNLSLSLKTLLENESKILEDVASNMSIRKNELSDIIKSFDRKIEIHIPVCYTDFNHNNEYLVAYFFGDDSDLNQEISAFNKKGERIVLKLDKAPEIPVVSLKWQERIYYDPKLEFLQKVKIQNKSDIIGINNLFKVLEEPPPPPPDPIGTEEVLKKLKITDDHEPWITEPPEIEMFVTSYGTTLAQGAQEGSHNCYCTAYLGNYDENVWYTPFKQLMQYPYEYPKPNWNYTYWLCIVEDDYVSRVHHSAYDDFVSDYIWFERYYNTSGTSEDAQYEIYDREFIWEWNKDYPYNLY